MSHSTTGIASPGRLLLLDLDGTLVDSAPGLRAAINRMLAARHLAPLSLEEIRPMIGDGIAALVGRALVHRGAAPDPSATDQFAADYERSAADASPLFPGVRAMLGRAMQDGWRLAICTNKPEAPTRTLLSELGIGHLFAVLGCGDSFAVRKPDPEHVRATLAAAGAIAEHAVMLGDHRNDVVAANGAGVRSIFAGWGYGAPGMGAGADAVAAGPDAVPAIAARLLATGAFRGRAG